ncbi:peptide chain release factor N(5)-glutamine methyltransferase [bacterium]|nr:peptide chain release factor N(5)-glutamine methyltransferase [candidate division CSSED10-310 bacterium]
MANTWTIRDLLNWTIDFLKSKKIDTARLDSEILLSHALHISRLKLYLDMDRPVTPEERGIFKRLVIKRANYVPVAYLTGLKEFWSIPINVDSRVLIPRPETEKIVEVVLKRLGDRKGRYCLADLGTGSGCITIALGLELPNACFVASDISIPALKLAKQNFGEYKLSHRIQLVCGNWLDMLASDKPVFHAIISNPPYIDSDYYHASLPPDIVKHEPRIALYGGSKGLDAIQSIIASSLDFISPGGFLILEIGSDQGCRVKTLLEQTGYKAAEIIKDYSGRDRVAIGYKTKRIK